MTELKCVCGDTLYLASIDSALDYVMDETNNSCHRSTVRAYLEGLYAKGYEPWEDIIAFNDEHFAGWRESPLVHLSNALAGEVGEVCNDTKHMAGGGTNRRKPTRTMMAMELADVYVYLVLMAECLGYDDAGFRRIVREKMNENYSRMGAPRP